MKTLRTMAAFTLRDRQKIKDICEKCQIEDVVRWIRKKNDVDGMTMYQEC